MKRHTVMPETQTEFCFRMPIGSVSNDSNVERMENQRFGGNCYADSQGDPEPG